MINRIKIQVAFLFLYIHMGKGASLSETDQQNCTLCTINGKDRLASPPVVLKSMMMPSGHYFFPA